MATRRWLAALGLAAAAVAWAGPEEERLLRERVEELEARNAALERELAEARGELDRLRGTRAAAPAPSAAGAKRTVVFVVERVRRAEAPTAPMSADEERADQLRKKIAEFDNKLRAMRAANAGPSPRYPAEKIAMVEGELARLRAEQAEVGKRVGRPEIMTSVVEGVTAGGVRVRAVVGAGTWESLAPGTRVRVVGKERRGGDSAVMEVEAEEIEGAG